MIWHLNVYASPSIVKFQLLPDPELAYEQFYFDEPSHWLWIDEWLAAVESYANNVVRVDNEGETIVSPVRPNTFTVDSDVSAGAKVVFDNKSDVFPVDGMKAHFEDEFDVYITAKTVPDRSVVLVGTLNIPLYGQTEIHEIQGITLHTWEKFAFWPDSFKGIIILATEYMSDRFSAKFHAVDFAHEWGHYAGIWGHPRFEDGAGQIMATSGVHPETRTFEPWFQVAMSPEVRDFYEGKWREETGGRRVPEIIPGFEIEDGDKFFDSFYIRIVPPWN